MSNIRIRKDAGRPFLDFRVFGLRCREQTEPLDTKPNCKLLINLDEKIKVAVANGSYRHEQFFPMSKRIAEVEEARLAINTPTTINNAPPTWHQPLLKCHPTTLFHPHRCPTLQLNGIQGLGWGASF